MQDRLALTNQSYVLHLHVVTQRRLRLKSLRQTRHLQQVAQAIQGVAGLAQRSAEVDQRAHRFHQAGGENRQRQELRRIEGAAQHGVQAA